MEGKQSLTANEEKSIPPMNEYSKDYMEAVALLQAGRDEECVRLAQYHLTDPRLPRHHQLKNLIIIVMAEDDWYEAEVCFS